MVRPDLITSLHSSVAEEPPSELDEITLALINIAVANENQEENPENGAEQHANGPPVAEQPPLVGQPPAASTPHASVPTSTPSARRLKVPRVAVPSRESSEVRRKATRSAAGKRRQRRWHNQCFVHSLAHRMLETAVGTELTHEEARMLMSEGRNLLEPTQGAFTDLMSDPDAVETWERFNNLNEARQQAVLDKISRPAKRHAPTDATRPEARYRRVERSTRQYFKRRGMDAENLPAVEQQLLTTLGQSEESRVHYVEPDSYLRMLAHAVCQYCYLPAKSVTVNGNKGLLITKPTQYTPPHLPLSGYLASLHESAVALPKPEPLDLDLEMQDEASVEDAITTTTTEQSPGSVEDQLQEALQDELLSHSSDEAVYQDKGRPTDAALRFEWVTSLSGDSDEGSHDEYDDDGEPQTDLGLLEDALDV
eukprot:m.75094 g.75094  ORF g.75094 m.75094 type:complete len:424 (-) comp14394_c0_seq1:2280-3551(-)